MPDLIGYRRVSTTSQGESGLGLEAQEAAIAAYARSVGGTVLHTYTEIESGRKCDRTALAEALAHAKRASARLVIAKLDRLGRNVHFISSLMESRVDFLCCDNPHANRLTLHLLAAIGEHEAAMISTRTREALKAAKARGAKLGFSRDYAGKEAIQRRGVDAARRKRLNKSRAVYAACRPLAESMRATGHTLERIAETFNAQGIHTPMGKLWNPTAILRLLRTPTSTLERHGISPANRNSQNFSESPISINRSKSTGWTVGPSNS